MFPGKCSVVLEPEVFAALKCVYSNSNDSVTRCLTLHVPSSLGLPPPSSCTQRSLRAQRHTHIHNTLALISLPTSPTAELAKRMPMHLCHAHTADACLLVAKSFQASSLTRGKIMFTFAATDVLTSNIELSVSSFWIYFSIAAPTRQTRIQLLRIALTDRWKKKASSEDGGGRKATTSCSPGHYSSTAPYLLSKLLSIPGQVPSIWEA